MTSDSYPVVTLCIPRLAKPHGQDEEKVTTGRKQIQDGGGFYRQNQNNPKNMLCCRCFEEKTLIPA
jgi:hypothetical protein